MVAIETEYFVSMPFLQLVWKLYVGGKKAYRLEVTEDSEAFSHDRAPDTLVSNDTIERVARLVVQDDLTGLEGGWF